MTIRTTLDTIHEKMTSNRLLQMFTAFTRCLLAVGFIPPSIPKILHKPFTVLPDSNPVGHYFNALYHTGFYYEFIGWAQLTAALLLLFPRTAHIGALMFLPIIANIAVLTCSVGFQGTWLLTIFMLLAASWLTAWEYDRLKPIIFFDRDERAKPFRLRLFGFRHSLPPVGSQWPFYGGRSVWATFPITRTSALDWLHWASCSAWWFRCITGLCQQESSSNLKA